MSALVAFECDSCGNVAAVDVTEPAQKVSTYLPLGWSISPGLIRHQYYCLDCVVKGEAA